MKRYFYLKNPNQIFSLEKSFTEKQKMKHSCEILKLPLPTALKIIVITKPNFKKFNPRIYRSCFCGT